MQTKARLKRWGSSLGLVVPSDVVKRENLKEGEEVVVSIHKKNPLMETFGTLRDWKADAQRVKDEARKGWGK
jgi:antitoxin component of MazEF toxin-antitoxin module